MSKNIVFCADGTWNHPSDPDVDDSQADPSNVYKLFLKLKGVDDHGTIRLANEQGKTLYDTDGTTPIQVAKYIHGVGDSNNILVKWLGGGFGEGLITRIVRGYTFVSRNYQPGDKIYLVGFSRGAYIARALAGLITAKGLLPTGIASDQNKDEAYRRGSAVWYAWRRDALDKVTRPIDQRLQEFVRDLPHFLFEPPAEEALVDAEIEAVAVWDTVGSYGIPQFDLRDKRMIDTFEFADNKLNDKVRFGRHAVSIDEQRINFTPTLWNGDAGHPDRIVQVLFPGGHADVGGSNIEAESGLSDCALQWMTRELKKLGLEIGPPVIPENRDACSAVHELWQQLHWQLLGVKPRTIPAAPELCLSEAVLLRLANAQGLLKPAYEPGNIASYLAAKLAAMNVKVIPLDP